MCAICTQALKLKPKEAVALIAAEMKKGRAAAHFDKVMDEILGTTLPEVDTKADAAWERSTRSSRKQ